MLEPAKKMPLPQGDVMACGAAPSPAVGRSYAAPEGRWVCLSAALRANEPSGESDDLGDKIRTRPPRSRGAQRS